MVVSALGKICAFKNPEQCQNSITELWNENVVSRSIEVEQVIEKSKERVSSDSLINFSFKKRGVWS